ncbi:MAG: hypothetical protein K1X86_14135 [Ignavibacteria bacterium]|nr:hypothetical protein [Ignavibacteria bacterium]
MEKLPLKLKKYFWDTNFEELTWEKYSKYIAEGILSLVEWEDVLWLKERMSDDKIVALVNSRREINRKTKNYWNTRLT